MLVAINLAALILVFPTGLLPSARWRPAALAGLVLTGLTLASFVVSTRQVALPAPGGISLVYPNPLVIRSLRPVTWLGTLSGLALIVLGIGTFAGHRSDPLLTIAAAVAIALVFQPLRQRTSLLANRLVYGERATQYQVLSDFAADMAGQLDLGDALDRMAALLGGASGASRVEAWIRVGAELRRRPARRDLPDQGFAFEASGQHGGCSRKCRSGSSACQTPPSSASSSTSWPDRPGHASASARHTPR